MRIPRSPLYDLEPILKTSVSDQEGLAYMTFRKTLFPRYARVWGDILLGYLFLSASLLVPIHWSQVHPSWTLPLALLCALGVGFWTAYLQLFIHEAAHYNLASDRKLNDLLSNLFVASWAGLHTDSYRKVHWDHHRFLGRPNDSESTYFSALTFRFILRTLTGAEARRVLKDRKGKQGPGALPMRLAGMALHAGILACLVLLGHWPYAAAWTAGVLSFFPFFAAIRQLLEHRSEKASRSVDYRKKPHGKTVRLFKAGPLGSFLGGAGFRHHLLHHWDPQVSYTRLGEVEDFLSRTRLAKGLSTARTTYGRVFLSLFKA